MRIRKGSGVAEGCMPCVFIYFCPILDGRTDVVLSLVQSVLPLRYLIEIWERDKTAAVTAIH